MNVRELIFLGWKIFKIVISHISSNTKFNNFAKRIADLLYHIILFIF